MVPEVSHRNSAGSGDAGQDQGQGSRSGADDSSLTAAGGMLPVTEQCERLGLIVALGEGMVPVK
jgi:hypothetical protein